MKITPTSPKDFNGTTAWRAVVHIKGYPIVCNHFERKHQAEDWARDLDRQIKLGQHNNILAFSLPRWATARSNAIHTSTSK